MTNRTKSLAEKLNRNKIVKDTSKLPFFFIIGLFYSSRLASIGFSMYNCVLHHIDGDSPRESPITNSEHL